MLGPELTAHSSSRPLSPPRQLHQFSKEDRLDNSNNSLRRFAMDAQTMGNCLVCGKETKNRCSRCVEAANIDLFFCSPECQKLVSVTSSAALSDDSLNLTVIAQVRPAHKLFCGAHAFPLLLPFPTPAEAEVAIARLDEPLISRAADGRERTMSLYEAVQELLMRSRSEMTVRCSIPWVLRCSPRVWLTGVLQDA